MKDVRDFYILQALIPEALRGLAFGDQLDTFKGKDGHDTDGSLSLGSGEASGRSRQCRRAAQL